MYAPPIIQRSQERLEQVYAAALPHGLVRHPVAHCELMAKRLANAVDPQGQPARRLTPEEDAFIANERLLSKVDYRYIAERYHYIRGDRGLQRLYPLWEPQEVVLGRLARLQTERAESGHPDGLLANIVKARQEGCSTIVQSLVAHRVTTFTHVNALTASDVPENSGSEGIFGKFELIVEHLPWYLRPATKFHKKDTHWVFGNGSWMTVESGKSMKGGLQDEGGTKGNLGRSKTFTVAHLTELSTWERGSQIDDGLLPAIPRSPLTLVVKESTAKGRHNWHHEDWLEAVKGRGQGSVGGRFIAIFLPWYALSKYWLPAPLNWSPDEVTLAHAAKAAHEGPKWLDRPVTLSRHQLYWYETTRSEYTNKGEIARFLEEFAADPEECFQAAGRSIFTYDQLAYLDRLAHPMIDCWTIQPAADLAAFKVEELAEIRRAKALAALEADAPHGPSEPLVGRVEVPFGR
jgi:hypothetical protein